MSEAILFGTPVGSILSSDNLRYPENAAMMGKVHLFWPVSNFLSGSLDVAEDARFQRCVSMNISQRRMLR